MILDQLSTSKTMNNKSYCDYMIEILTALKEGKAVQRENETTKEWMDHNNNIIPSFDKYIYRIKPDVKIISCKLALMKNLSSYYTVSADSHKEERMFETSSYFVKWLTDWITYEIEE